MKCRKWVRSPYALPHIALARLTKVQISEPKSQATFNYANCKADQRLFEFEALGFPWSLVIGFWDLTVPTDKHRWEINNIIKATF